MSDATTDFARMLSPQDGDRFVLDHGEICVDYVTADEVYFVRHGSPVRMPIDVWREAVRRYQTRNDQPTMTCPKCGVEMEDFDGVGVLAHAECGYCTHPSADVIEGRSTCGICGETWERSMTKCKHENAEHLFAGGLVGPGWNMSGYVAQCEQFRCLDCSAWLSLGHSDERASEQVEIEIKLAELLAETECFWEPCGAKDEQFDLYIDIFATDEPPRQLRKPGPRSPIEMMVDAACGYTHDGAAE